MKLQGTFMEYFWTWNYVNYLSEVFVRDHYRFISAFKYVLSVLSVTEF